MAELLTIGDIARQLGIARSRLDYAVAKVGIRERGRAGILRLYGHDQIPSMRAALESVRPYKAGNLQGDHPVPRTPTTCEGAFNCVSCGKSLLIRNAARKSKAGYVCRDCASDRGAAR